MFRGANQLRLRFRRMLKAESSVRVHWRPFEPDPGNAGEGMAVAVRLPTFTPSRSKSALNVCMRVALAWLTENLKLKTLNFHL